MHEPPEDGPDALVDAAWRAYREAQPEAGVAHARAAAASFPEHGPAWYALAVCLERAGRLGEADRAFRRADACADDPQQLPFRISAERFRREVDDAVRLLPERLRAAIAEVTLIVTDYADPELLAEQDADELLGLFAGRERAELHHGGDISPCIYVFRRAHEHACADEEEMRAEIRRTVWHEFGHYLGYDEEGLDALGMG